MIEHEETPDYGDANEAANFLIQTRLHGLLERRIPGPHFCVNEDEIRKSIKSAKRGQYAIFRLGMEGIQKRFGGVFGLGALLRVPSYLGCNTQDVD